MYQNRNSCREAHDFGCEPIVIDIDRAAAANPNYRTAIWTGEYLQVTLMSIPVGGDVGLEVHPDADQFIRIEQGSALVKFGKNENCMRDVRKVNCHFAVIIPAGTWHNIVNCGKTPLKLYSVYAPPHHPFGTVQRTKGEAEREH